MPTITIYTTTFCSYCRSAKAFFDMKGLVYQEVNLTGNDEARTALRDRTGHFDSCRPTTGQDKGE